MIIVPAAICRVHTVDVTACIDTSKAVLCLSASLGFIACANVLPHICRLIRHAFVVCQLSDQTVCPKCIHVMKLTGCSGVFPFLHHLHHHHIPSTRPFVCFCLSAANRTFAAVESGCAVRVLAIPGSCSACRYESRYDAFTNSAVHLT